MAKNLINIIKSINAEHTTEAFEIQNFLQLLSIDNTFGENLNVIGGIVGEFRADGDDDGAYRIKLKEKIALNIASGDRETIILAMKHYLGHDSFSVMEIDANIIAVIIGGDVPTKDQVNRIKQVVGAGIGIYIHYIIGDPFQYDTGLGYDNGHYSFLVGSK